jgi:hypothetical protein
VDLFIRASPWTQIHPSNLIRNRPNNQQHNSCYKYHRRPKSTSRERKKTIGRLSSKKKPKVNKSLAASDVLFPPLPNSVPLAAAHPQQEVTLAFPLNLVPPVVLEQPPAPPNPAAAEQVVDDDSLDDPTTVESVHRALITTRMRRESIAYVFLHVLGAPAEEKRTGHDGTISKIQKLLNSPLGSHSPILKVWIFAWLRVSRMTLR